MMMMGIGDDGHRKEVRLMDDRQSSGRSSFDGRRNLKFCYSAPRFCEEKWGNARVRLMHKVYEFRNV